VNTVKGTTVRIDDTTTAAGIAATGLNRAGRRAESRRLRRAGAALAVVPAALGTTALLVGGTAVPAGAATLTVTSLDDSVSDGSCDADCTLRDALGDANDGDTIVFADGLTGDYDITTELDIDDAVTIQGPGAGVIAIDGTDTTEIFQLGADSTDTITITGLTLKNGSSTSGGAIRNNGSGNLVVDSVVFDGNDATPSGGGAIYQNAGILTVTNSTFTGNTSADYGGAIYANYLDGPLTITGSTFTGNESTGQGGGALYAAYDENNDVFDLVVTDSTFTGNTASDKGGAIYAFTINDVTITGSTFTDNTSDSGGGAVKVYGDDDNAVVTITDTTISGNTADGYGGGLYVSYVVDLTITGSTITDNTADAEGGGGGYLYSIYGDISITDSTISGNTAGTYGGGLYLGSDIGSDGGSVTITRTTIADNTATGDTGGGLYLNDLYVPVTVRSSTISGNTATAGGGIYFSTFQGDAAAALIIENSTISGNSATVGDGGGIFFGDTAYDLELVMTTITANTAGGGGDGIYFQPPAVPPFTAAKAPRADRTGPKGTATPRAPRERGPRASVAGTQSATGAIIWGNGTEDLGGTGTLTSTKNVIGTKAADITVTGTALATDPLLGPLTDNGGPTQTHALLVGSPAIDAGPTPVPTFPGNEYDQRGPDYTRVVNGTTDIGAYEVQPLDPDVPGVITFTG